MLLEVQRVFVLQPNRESEITLLAVPEEVYESENCLDKITNRMVDRTTHLFILTVYVVISCGLVLTQQTHRHQKSIL